MKSDVRLHPSKPVRPLARLAILAGVVLLGAALWWGPSAALRYTLDRSFAAIGYRVVGMGQVAVSLVERRIDVARIELEQPGGGTVNLDLVDLQISPAALLSGRIDVPRARIAGLSVEIVRMPDGTIRVAGIPVVAAASPPGAAAGGPMLAVGISDFELSYSRVTLRNGEDRVEIAIGRLAVDGLVLGDPTARMRFELAATVGGRPLKLAGTAMPFAAAPEVSARFEADGLALGPLAKLFGQVFAGTLDATLDLKITGGKPAEARASAEGALALRGAAAGELAAASLSWRGTLSHAGGGRIQGKGTLDAGDVSAADGDRRVALGSGRYDGTFDVAGDRSSTLAGTLALDALSLSGGGTDELLVRTLRLDTQKLAYRSGGDVAGRVTLEATALAGKAAAGALRAATLHAQGELAGGPREQTFDGILEIVTPNLERADERYAADRIGVESVRFSRSDRAGTLRGAVAIDGLKVATADIDLTAEKARYEGSVDLKADGTAVSGRITTGKLRAGLKAADVVATLGAALFDGSLEIGSAVAIDGRIRLDALSVVDPTARELFAAATLDLGGFAFGPAGTSALRIAMTEPRLLRREKALAGREAFGWRLRAPRASLDDARFAPDGGIAVASLRVEQPTIRITRTKNGFLSFERGAPPVAGAPAGPVAPSPGLSVGRFEIVDGRATFEDRTPHDTVRVPLDRLALVVSDLDDRRPERPSSVSLAARVGTFGEAKVSGAVFPFAPLLSFDIEFAARAIDLPPISAYADQALGVEVRTGTATVDGRLVARQEKLEGNTRWRISNIRLDERETNAQALARQAGAPIGTALALLADDDNNIELDIPVAGELSNPTFDTADAVRQAVGGALRGALSGTLTVLFPFGSIFSAVVDAERRGTGIALPAVSFANGTSDLEGPVVEVVDGLAKLMAARPAARLEVCGFAGPGDADAIPGRSLARGPADEDALRRLAASRAASVKRRLVESAKIDPARIFECRPVVEEAADAQPRAELRF